MTDAVTLEDTAEVRKSKLANIKAFNDMYKEVEDIDDIDREFELRIGKYVSKNAGKDGFELFCESMIKDKLKKSYCAFFALNIHLRRKNKIEQLSNLLNKNKNNFECYKSYNFLKLLCKMNEDKYNFGLLEFAYNLCINLGYRSQVLHAYCEVVANLYESGAIIIRNSIQNDYLDECIQFINQAIDDEKEYAKYYCTRARIYLILAETEKNNQLCESYYQQSLKDIRYAYLHEKDGEFFQLKIESYERYESMILMKFNLFLSVRASEENIQVLLENKLKDNNIKNFEILGLFAAIVSFTIGSLNMIESYEFKQVSLLIVILSASILCIYSGLGVILHKEKNRMMVFIFSAIAILFSISIGVFML